MIIKKIILIFLVYLMCLFRLAYAEGIGLNQSRIIYMADKKYQVIDVNNRNNDPYLIQSSVLTTPDGGVSDNFIVAPPLFRINANSDYAIKILAKDISSLPKDKESMFYFKIRAIPSVKPADKNKADLVFITAIIIKMHFRPESLAMPSHTVYGMVRLTRESNLWVIDNPTPYYMTVVNLTINNNLREGSILIPPSGKVPIEMNSEIQQSSWQIINDFGGLTPKFNYIKEKDK